jgi:hypothetical protein
MKKLFYCLTIIVILVLSACSSQGSEAQVTTATEVAAAEVEAAETVTPIEATSLNTTYENAVSIPMQLILGTLELNTTAQALTKEQADTLIPLWTDYATLSMSMVPGQGLEGDTDTQTQLDDLIAQIEAAMTPDQINTIAAMQITQESASKLMDELGITVGMGTQGGVNPPLGQDGTNPPQKPGDINPPAGQDATPPENPDSGNPPTGQKGTPPAMRESPVGSGSMMISPELINALLQSLGSISGVTITPVSMGAPGARDMQPPTESGTGGDYTITATYQLDGGSKEFSGQTYTANDEDKSAVYVLNGGILTLKDAIITTSGDTSSQDNSSFYGLNAAVLAASGGMIDLSDSTITTSGLGANGAFATGSGSSVTLSNVTIYATGDGGHGVMATQGGTLTLNNVTMTTAGKNSGVVATDRGSGTITMVGGSALASGQDSPAVYSTGVINISNASLSATGAEAAVIEGANSITLTDCTLTSSKEKWGVMIYQSMSGDAEGTQGTFTMTGGKLEYTPTSGPLFYVTNSTGVITLKNVEVTNGSGILINAAAGNWGNAGENGGTVIFTADNQALEGDLVADTISSIDLTLQNRSSLKGTINPEGTAKFVNLTLDATSTWTVTANSTLTRLLDTSGITGTTITNIIGNGFTVTYDSAANPELGGKTYTLTGGGYLKPKS